MNTTVFKYTSVSKLYPIHQILKFVLLEKTENLYILQQFVN